GRAVLCRAGGGTGIRRHHAQGPAHTACAADLAATCCHHGRRAGGIMMALAAQVSARKLLPALLAGLETSTVPGVAVSGITLDSRSVRPGDLFLACPGLRQHGLAHADQAVRAGAAAIAWDAESAPELTVPNVRVGNLT